jgi:ATP-dependent Lon protease
MQDFEAKEREQNDFIAKFSQSKARSTELNVVNNLREQIRELEEEIENLKEERDKYKSLLESSNSRNDVLMKIINEGGRYQIFSISMNQFSFLSLFLSKFLLIPFLYYKQ